MINDYCEGGLKMIDLISFNKSLKTSWIQKYLDSSNNGKWKVFFDLALQNYGRENVFTGNLNIKDTITSRIHFWKNCLNSGRKLTSNRK